MAQLILFNKPFRVLSQFTDTRGRTTLSRYLQASRVRVAGRLDYDSEGLLLLTDDGRLQQRIAHPRHKTWKTYLVQVEGRPSAEDLDKLREGVTLRDGATLPARVAPAPAAQVEAVWPRHPPVRYRKNVADSWLELSICEGRNRQVRRMTAAIGFPTLRLIRTRIGDWRLDSLAPGEYRESSVHLPSETTAKRRRRTP